jgi:hypothetical protein
MPRIHWVDRGTGIGIPKDRDEVNRREVCECETASFCVVRSEDLREDLSRGHIGSVDQSVLAGRNRCQGLENTPRNKVFSNMWEGRDPHIFLCPSGYGYPSSLAVPLGGPV